MEIHVFKTNLASARHISKVKPALNRHPFIKDWNVDLQDCDKVLRVVSDNIPSTEIEQIILNSGYNCKELK